MQRIFPEIISNRRIAENIYEMKLRGDFTAVTNPGQFVELTVDGCYLRRPISVCDAENDVLTLVFKTVGKGTEKMSNMSVGKKVDMLVGLGNGYDISKSGERPLLVGGGIGVPPLWLLCRRLIEKGAKPTVILGAGSAPEVFYRDEFEKVGATVYVTTADGSYGVRGFVTDALPEVYDTFCACGPLPMLRALCRAADKPGFLSLEARMGCGFGACMGCTIETLNGPKRVCREGPVFRKEELLW